MGADAAPAIVKCSPAHLRAYVCSTRMEKSHVAAYYSSVRIRGHRVPSRDSQGEDRGYEVAATTTTPTMLRKLAGMLWIHTCDWSGLFPSLRGLFWRPRNTPSKEIRFSHLLIFSCTLDGAADSQRQGVQGHHGGREESAQHRVQIRMVVSNLNF